jgi:hypothetical protein
MADGYIPEYDPLSPRTGLGCVFIIPAALFGSALLIEGHLYSGRWYLLVELVGWWTICFAVAFSCAMLVARAREQRSGGYRFALAALALAITFTLVTAGVAQPNTPDWAKDFFIGLLQVIGIAAPPALLAYLAWAKWKSSTR